MALPISDYGEHDDYDDYGGHGDYDDYGDYDGRDEARNARPDESEAAEALRDLAAERAERSANHTPAPAYAREILVGVADHLAEVDEAIETYAQGWTIRSIWSEDNPVLLLKSAIRRIISPLSPLIFFIHISCT